MKCFKTFKKILIIALVFAIIMIQHNITSEVANENDKTKNKHTITTPYKYPIKPGTDEWKKLKTRTEKADICQIPNDILKSMTTEALVETVINYPLRADMFAQNSLNKGYQFIYDTFNGLQELTSRSDAVDKLEKYKENIKSDKSILESTYVDVLIDGINGRYGGLK